MEPRTRFGKLLCYGLLLFGGVLFMFPFVWLVSTAIKPDEQATTMPPRWIPYDYHAEIHGQYLQVRCGEPANVPMLVVRITSAGIPEPGKWTGEPSRSEFVSCERQSWRHSYIRC